MKNLEKDKLKILLDIIGSNPALQIAHFVQSSEIIIDMLNEYCQKRDYQYQINVLENAFYEQISEKFKNTDTTQVKNFPLERKSYMIQGKQYDFIFVTATINNDIRADFLKKVHHVMRNAGNIIIFISKGDLSERDNWITLLEEENYVATNTIDDLFEYYDIIISKKMHGWGNK